MRIRPFFWLLFACICACVLIFAASIQVLTPAQIEVHLAQHIPTAHSITTLEIHLTDADGLPIEKARIIPGAHMTNMPMSSRESQIHMLGDGKYVVQFHLYMAGPWEITIHTDATGYMTPVQSVRIEVT